MIEVKITGLEDVTKRLHELVPKLQRRALHNALAAGARVVRDAARQALTQQRGAAAFTKRSPTGYIPGTVENAIRVRTSKAATAAGNVGVYVNVKPISRGKVQPGVRNPNDPFYWSFVEFGTVKFAGHAFLRPAATRLDQALDVFTKTLGPQIQKLDTNPDDPL